MLSVEVQKQFKRIVNPRRVLQLLQKEKQTLKPKDFKC
jgi:hypothetical protein